MCQVSCRGKNVSSKARRSPGEQQPATPEVVNKSCFSLMQGHRAVESADWQSRAPRQQHSCSRSVPHMSAETTMSSITWCTVTVSVLCVHLIFTAKNAILLCQIMLYLNGALRGLGHEIIIRGERFVCLHKQLSSLCWLNKQADHNFTLLHFCLYVADPANFLGSNSVLETLFSFWELLVYSVMGTSISVWVCISSTNTTECPFNGPWKSLTIRISLSSITIIIDLCSAGW